MVKHYNPSIVQRAQRILNTKINNLPDEVGDLVAIIPITPVIDIVATATRTTSGAATVYTTPSDKDFYLTALIFTLTKDATCDMATGAVAVTAFLPTNATAQPIASHNAFTLTAQDKIIEISFPIPIKLTRGTLIALGGNTFTAGTCYRGVTVYGYTEETTAS